MIASRLLLGIACIIAAIGPAPVDAQSRQLTERVLSNLPFRSLGPAVTGGRIHDVEALPNDPSTLYVASASGGIWKSTNQATTWTPLFDHEAVSTFGDLAIAPSDPNVIWAGTGEQNNRQSTSWGNGVYRSTDAGETWTQLGLAETRHIGRVRVHPSDPNTAYVAALGNLWKATPDRGVYKTTDGGATWEHVLAIDTLTGVVDLAMDPSNPNVLYAAAYQRLRRAWGFNGGGPGSGIYKTDDGGDTWTELTNGIPSGDKGRIGIALAPGNTDVLYITVEHADSSGTYRTDDAGATWEKVNDLNPRPMYYSHIVVDPLDAERVYIMATEFYRSDDGGRTFREMPTRPSYDVGVHSDFHTLWIDPTNTEHFYLAGDAGLHETFDRGETYTRHNNIPIGQFYGIGVDQRDPFLIYGGMQDNHSWMGPSATRRWIGIVNDDWSQIGFGDGMYQQPDPFDDRVVYVTAQNGSIQRMDPETGDRLDIRPFAPDGDEYRFDWVTPVLASRHRGGTVYLGGNRLFISRDRGNSWARTEDLTKQIDRDTLLLMGIPGADSILSRNDGTSTYGEITTLAESPLTGDVLWVGTDDGNVQVSRDGGLTWAEVGQNVPGIDHTTYVSRVTPSVTDTATAYVAFDAHRRGDFAPYLFRTTDAGRSWEALSEAVPVEAGSINEIVEHPRAPNLLFIGAEHGLFVSGNAGGTWVRYAGLPTTHYDDLVIHERDNALVAGTHGRSIWILDDLTPLEQWATGGVLDEGRLFSVEAATIHLYWKATSYRGQAAFNGANPSFGAAVHYYLPESGDSITLTVRNEAGDVVRTLMGDGEGGIVHRVMWDLRHEPPPPSPEDDEPDSGVVLTEVELPSLPRALDTTGPFVSPGEHTVTLERGDLHLTQRIAVRSDPDVHLSQREWRERERFLLDVLDLQRRAHALESALVGEDDESDEATEQLDEAEDIRRDLERLADSFNGSGVRQGTLRSPTATHRARLARIRETLAALERETEGE